MPISIKIRTMIFWLLVLLCLGVYSIAFAAKQEAGHFKARDITSSNAKTANADGDLPYRTYDSLFTLSQPYIKNISAYRPICFLAGVDPSETRFQFSFKYRIFNPKLSVSRKHGWLKNIYLAYTQTSFWDIASNSAPFKDSSYKPEFFYITENLLKKDAGPARLFLKAGYQHESNGRGEDFSRSTNFLYVNPIFIFYNEKSRIGLKIAPRLWAYVANDDDTNPDLNDFRGYFDLEVKAGIADGFILDTHFQSAKKGSSLFLDLSYPLNNLFENIDLYFQVEYVNALAENLINYKRRTHALRLGFAIVR